MFGVDAMAFGSHGHEAPATELPAAWSEALVTAILPTYNEATNIEKIVRELATLPLPQLRIIVVDDNSPDGTADLAESLAKSSASRGGRTS